MKKHLIFMILFGVSLVLNSVQADELEGKIKTSIAQRLEYALIAQIMHEQTFHGDGPLFQEYETTALLTWDYSPRYDFFIGYKNEGRYLDKDWNISNEAIFGTRFKLNLKGIQLSSKQEFQLGDEEGDFLANLEQNVRLSYVSERIPFKLVPFIEDQWKIDLTAGDITENEIKTGFRVPLNEKMKIETYVSYMNEWKTFGNSSFPIVGLELEINF
jgi:hypothetical protein